ncbi:hypothetical protein [Caloranaerobacter azorensis]|uniref:Uncharacterized protein n=1 Tax=Caloranaerobacter azorensis TaxID=116090 RepID=A0A6P1YFG6_9FIRM|nr:hypothetical protein [Caloranaerobacter azorensis]QIB27662.1 hypothetical protein G3A45_10405 [Caloranaerobacter azorensis]
MKKVFIVIIFLTVLAFVIFNIQRNNINPLLQLEINTVDKLIIRTQMINNCPEEKKVIDKDEINKVLTLLRQTQLKKYKSIDDENGWQFWIIMNGLSIRIIENKVFINEEVYKTNTDIVNDLLKIYRDLKAAPHKYYSIQ